MGGCRPPQAPFRLVVDHSLPPMENPKTEIVEKVVEKIVVDEKALNHAKALQQELDTLKARLKIEGEKTALLSQELAQKPREIIKKVPHNVEVEKIVEKIVRLEVPAEANRIAWVWFAVSAALGFGLGALLL